MRAEHPLVATSLNNLATLYEAQGRYSEATPLHERSLSIREKSLGPDHFDVGLSSNNLALLYYRQGRLAEAEALYKKSLTISEKSVGLDHPFVATVRNNLAVLLEKQGQSSHAEPLYRRALAIRERALGTDHPEVANSLNNLALLYYRQGRYADAEPLYKRSLGIVDRSFNPAHPHIALTLNNLAALYNRQGRYADALPIIRRTIAARTTVASIALPILLRARQAKQVSEGQALADSYAIFQLTSSSPASDAITKIAQRNAAGSTELATLVRRDQDLSYEDAKLDKAIFAAVSKQPSERNRPAEDQLRKRSAEIGAEKINSSGISSEVP